MNIKKQTIRLLVMDSDGTLTDGKIYYGTENLSVLSFSVKDGYGIKNILPQHNIEPVIISGRCDPALERRAADLGVTLLYQSVTDKESCLRKVISDKGFTLSQVAYIGDDLNDRDCLSICGISGCPADAVETIKPSCCFISRYNGGHGAVREFIDWLVDTEGDVVNE